MTPPLTSFFVEQQVWLEEVRGKSILPTPALSSAGGSLMDRVRHVAAPQLGRSTHGRLFAMLLLITAISTGGLWLDAIADESTPTNAANEHLEFSPSSKRHSTEFGEVEVSVAMEKPEFMLGEPAVLLVTVKYLIRAAQAQDYDLRFSALEGLSKFNSDEALRGIEIGLATSVADMRKNASNDQLQGDVYETDS